MRSPISYNRNALITIFFLALTFLIVMLRNAWVCDDAFVTFRTIDNFIHGYGLRWNVDERVQAFTNPLWMFLLSGFYFFTHEIYFTVIVVSILISLGTLLFFTLQIAESWMEALFGVSVLLLSKAYIDYSTSGLENPLTHFFLVLFFWHYVRALPSSRSLFKLTLIAALGIANRQDISLLFIPPLVSFWIRSKPIKSFSSLVIGFLPVVAWELFSLFYYGFLFPNTAYAKLNTGIPSIDLAYQGVTYLIQSVSMDPATLLIILVGSALPFLKKDKLLIPAAVGVILYLLYIVKVGGDFMTGRFLTAPLLVSVMIIARGRMILNDPSKGWLPFGAILIIGLLSPFSPLKSDIYYGLNRNDVIDEKGIADERAYYYQSTGLLRIRRNTPMPDHPWMQEGQSSRVNDQKVVVRGTIGFFGFGAGPKVHVIDYLALSDPLLARLPILSHDPLIDRWVPQLSAQNWRIGHFFRSIPDGYIKTIATGKNFILDESLSQYYDKLSFIIRGPLFSLDRLKEIIKMNLRQYRSLTNNYVRHPSPRQLTVSLSELRRIKTPGTAWDDPDNFPVSESGLQINMEGVQHKPFMEMSVDHNDNFRLSYLQKGRTITTQDVQAKLLPDGGLNVYHVQIPEVAVKEGYDQVVMLPMSHDRCSVGHLVLLD